MWDWLVRATSGLWQRAAEAWRTSLQVKVIGSIAAASVTVIMVLGFVMISVVAQRLVDSKLAFASQEIDRARVIVEAQVAATDTSNSVQVRLNSARAALTSRSQATSDTAAVFEPVLVVRTADGAATTSPEGYVIPEQLLQFVDRRYISYQYTTVTRADNTHYKALIIGTPTDSDISNLELFLVFPLDNEEATMALTRGLLTAGGLVLVLLLVVIAWLSTKQVTGPLRSAARIAERFAGGHLRERMLVDGEDEMARLAESFNAMAESLSKQIRQLEEYGDLQRQFTSDVSHELRTPLTTVRMAADMISDQKDDLDPVTRRAAELMVRELDRFESLLADLLEISRHDAGMADLAEERVDVRAVVSSAWQQTQHLAAELGVPVLFDLPDEPVYATIDSRRIERILRNLLANAIDHSESRPVEVLFAANEEAIAITVTDHGVGLKPGQEDLVFNRFWRADPSRVRHSGGTGLGLAISHEDAVLHGGVLDAAGTPGVGSVFRLTIPRTPGEYFMTSPLELLPPEPVEDDWADHVVASAAALAGAYIPPTVPGAEIGAADDAGAVATGGAEGVESLSPAEQQAALVAEYFAEHPTAGGASRSLSDFVARTGPTPTGSFRAQRPQADVPADAADAAEVPAAAATPAAPAAAGGSDPLAGVDDFHEFAEEEITDALLDALGDDWEDTPAEVSTGAAGEDPQPQAGKDTNEDAAGIDDATQEEH
ncbi:two-component sensor histidine kinase [Corynebacterium sp. 13CS0277]|uniref:MtrAB system histidine kinase MtrB n=1 Tax=Corynebacterium sp. 13CS0277 TaxID=2071994 RepID=UPI000D0309F3|nr:two-component sensor histidine kinase [Corynebacterium sp. 13CS0277]